MDPRQLGTGVTTNEVDCRSITRSTHIPLSNPIEKSIRHGDIPSVIEKFTEDREIGGGWRRWIAAILEIL